MRKIQCCLCGWLLVLLFADVRGQDGGLDGDLYPLANEQPLEEDLEEMGNIPKRNTAPGPRDCAEIRDENPLAQSGVYTIFPPTCRMCYFHVYCDMDSEGGGWTVIMNRFNGTVDFYRGKYFYKMGFGDINGEYYLGNQRIHQLTTMKPMELKMCMVDVGGVQTVAGYSHFYLGNMSANFPLHIDSYYGDAGDYLTTSNGSGFSTFDMDMDGAPQNCPKYFHSAWWYHTYGTNCGSQTNPFGYYFLGKKDLPQFAGPGISWKPVPGPGGPAIRSVVWKLRPLGYIGGSKREGNNRAAGGGEGPIVRARRAK